MTGHPLQRWLLAGIALLYVAFYAVSCTGDATLVAGWLPAWVLHLTLLLLALTALSLLWVLATPWPPEPEGIAARPDGPAGYEAARRVGGHAGIHVGIDRAERGGADLGGADPHAGRAAPPRPPRPTGEGGRRA